MREIFVLSYGLLCVLVVVQGFVLHQALRRAARLSRLCSESENHQNRSPSPIPPPWYIPQGTRLPEFGAPLLGTDRILTRADFQGQESILLFVSPADAASEARHHSYHQLGPAFNSMWETVEGQVYLVCRGNRQDCQRLIEGSPARAILDESGLLFRTFFIDKTPRAVQLDEAVMVIRYGEPDHVRNELLSTLDDAESDEAMAEEVAHNGVAHG